MTGARLLSRRDCWRNTIIRNNCWIPRISTKFFDGYIDSLDSRHENFLQSDLAEFAPYRTNLDGLTVNKSGAADLSPAFLIYQRFQERFHQRTPTWKNC